MDDSTAFFNPPLSGNERTYSWGDFINALVVAAKIYKTRIPIVIDGLNEAMQSGRFTRVWSEELAGFANEVAKYPELTLVTTCRPTYVEDVWRGGNVPNKINATGFGFEEIPVAVRRYFAAYNILADVEFAPLYQFGHPLYLKIFCEVHGLKTGEPKQVFIGEDSLFEILERYLHICNDRICHLRGQRRNIPIVQNAVGRIGQFLWENQTQYVPLTKAFELIDKTSIENAVWDSSLTNHIESEGLILCRDYFSNGEEEVSFAYDLLAGYIIAEYLIQTNETKLQEFLNSPDIIEHFFPSDRLSIPRFYQDIRRCLAVLLPKRTGKYLHELVDAPRALELSLQAMVEISPELVNSDTRNLLREKFLKATIENVSNARRWLRMLLPANSFVGHPLNMKFVHEMLLELSLANCDLVWTESIRRNQSNFESVVAQFEEISRKSKVQSPIVESRIHLVARQMMWVLTSTIRPLRDQATRALYYYGRKYPDDFFELLIESFRIKDPYVQERMLAAAYGIVVANRYSDQHSHFVSHCLPAWGRYIFDSICAVDASYKTTHILTREYALRLIDTALQSSPSILETSEIELLSPPYVESDLSWGECERLPDGEVDPIKMDFHNYTIGRLVNDRRNYQSDHADFQQVVSQIRWRIYNLGYSSQKFDAIDSELHSRNSMRSRSGDNSDQTDRYGKKYSYIAFFEQAGLRKARGLVEYWLDTKRIGDTDLDPTFPEDKAEVKHITLELLDPTYENTLEWIRHGDTPNLDQYLQCSEVDGYAGQWIALSLNISQESRELQRSSFTFVRGFLVHRCEATRAEEWLRENGLQHRDWLFASEYGVAFSGEYPWSDTISPNLWDKVEAREVVVMDIPEELSPEAISHFNQVFSERLTKLQEKYLEEYGINLEEVLNLDLNADDSSVYVSRSESQASFYFRIPMFKYFCPLASTASHINTSNSVSFRVLAKQIAEHAHLFVKPQSCVLFQAENVPATVDVSSYEGSGNSQHAFYIWKDVLDKYLADNNLDMIWAEWGERQFSVDIISGLNRGSYTPETQPWEMYEKVYKYTS